MSKLTAGKQTAKFKIKKGDTVMVVSGKDKGKKGLVLTVMPQDAPISVFEISKFASCSAFLRLKIPSSRYQCSEL
jgi:transcription antitermination factor NusG